MIELRAKKISVLEQTPQLVTDNIYSNIFLTEEYTNITLTKNLGIINSPDNFMGKNIYDKNKKIFGLSGGETQKVSLMRTISKNADVYIFDEGNSALDIRGKKIFADCLKNLKKESIILIVSHDENFISMSDCIISFNSHVVDAAKVI